MTSTWESSKLSIFHAKQDVSLDDARCTSRRWKEPKPSTGTFLDEAWRKDEDDCSINDHVTEEWYRSAVLEKIRALINFPQPLKPVWNTISNSVPEKRAQSAPPSLIQPRSFSWFFRYYSWNKTDIVFKWAQPLRQSLKHPWPPAERRNTMPQGQRKYQTEKSGIEAAGSTRITLRLTHTSTPAATASSGRRSPLTRWTSAIAGLGCSGHLKRQRNLPGGAC